MFILMARKPALLRSFRSQPGCPGRRSARSAEPRGRAHRLASCRWPDPSGCARLPRASDDTGHLILEKPSTDDICASPLLPLPVSPCPIGCRSCRAVTLDCRVTQGGAAGLTCTGISLSITNPGRSSPISQRRKRKLRTVQRLAQRPHIVSGVPGVWPTSEPRSHIRSHSGVQSSGFASKRLLSDSR